MMRLIADRARVYRYHGVVKIINPMYCVHVCMCVLSVTH